LKRPSLDYDLVVKGSGIEFAQVLSHRLSLKVKEYQQFFTATVFYRGYKIDIARAREETYPYSGALPRVSSSSLKKDLRRRDFTINAIALSLNKQNYSRIIDFEGGLPDLKRGLIRIMHKDSFVDDPTRIFRAIRFEKRFNFKIEEFTFNCLQEALNKKVLHNVSAQRIRDELFLIFEENNPLKYIKRIQRLVGFSFIDKNLFFNHQDFKIMRKIPRITKKFQKKHNTGKLDEKIIYLLAMLYFTDIHRTEKVCQRFSLSASYQKQLLSFFRYKNKVKKLSQRRVRRSKIYFTLCNLTPEVLCFCYIYFGNWRIKRRIRLYLKKLRYVKLSINGNIMRDLGLEPKSLYSKALDKLMAAKIDRQVNSPKQEVEYIKNIWPKLKKN
jgi:tRNA nucleotidyltransferase (CCA-adding enzyme)